VLLIKLVDRLHNLRTIAPLRPDKQERIARESLEIYAPLAHRLGMEEIKHEMEDRCFAILHPKRHAEIEALLRRRAPQREAYLERVQKEVAEALSEAGLKAHVSGRPKHHYSIYRKMVASGRPFEDIHDLIGIRILTQEVRDCYGALGVIHSMWPPIHGRFKDYIAMPKFNLYQSIHTTVVGSDGKPLEVQIRTREMHDRAEYGIASHWRYKEGVGPSDLPWMADIRFLQDEYPDPAEFLSGLKLDLYQDEVFVLTPKGDVMSLPKGATPVDFAYHIHTEVGHRCVGAKVNGRLVPLSTRLESGDIVDIVTSKAQDAGPSRDWLDFVRTSRASAKIRQWFSKERRQAAHSEGREQVARLLRREGLGLGAAERDRLLGEIADGLGQSDLDALYVAVGEGNLTATTVVNRLVRLVRPEDEDEAEDLLAPPRARAPRRMGSGVIVEGLDDLWVRIARCCAPVPGDDIAGFVTVGRGVSVHRADCTNVSALGEQSERMIDVSWEPERVSSFVVWLQVEALDRPRLLRDVTSVLSDLGGNIHASSSATGRDRIAVLRYEVELSDPGQLHRAISELKQVDGVFDAYRLVPQTES
ncbi:MAG: bifunctional (p)ppGpp synthetase/guanosine-3',5'-bis(diphosphate) 3'-pyrophosphohydrolase, partial [Actinomycetota bacterium]|nr:bifunctional (p)ppGpp synthetase/guanosine-3',5'-bis(diphosphate) 3'-pyrophosphohydrolase [Actinomycetota bacterium]